MQAYLMSCVRADVHERLKLFQDHAKKFFLCNIENKIAIIAAINNNPSSMG